MFFNRSFTKFLNFLLIPLFVVSCGGGGGSSDNPVIALPLPTVQLSSSATSVEINNEFTLTWSSTNASSCSASGDWSNTIGTSGSFAITESSLGTKTYHISCSGGGNTATDSVSVEITSPPAPSVSIETSVSSIVVNSSFTISWNSTNAVSCSASGDWNDSIGLSGSKTILGSEAGVKTYGVTCSGSDGSTAEDSVLVRIVPEESDTAFYGYVIDGYISSANIFIDQNYNFQQDSGEYTAVSNTDGSFVIETNDANLNACLSKRPIVANVPVGAVDSTLGGVTEAYQMILPSISDAGTNTIVISPFTTLFEQAIIDATANQSSSLSVAQGCQTEGDTISAAVTQEINNLRSAIENNFNVTYDELLSDFVVNPGEVVNETAAQNIAKLFPYLKIIDTEISSSLSSIFNKNIVANVALSEDALAIIFGGNSYNQLPLNFYSIYQTEPNAAGWYRSESIEASGALISNDGKLSRADCSENDTALCDLSSLTLQNISNTSTSYQKISNFLKDGDIDFTSLGIDVGSLNVSAQNSYAWRNNSSNWQTGGNRNRECQKQETISFRNSTGSGTDVNIDYSTYSQGFEKADCDTVRHYYTPILTATTHYINDNDSLEARYYIFDILKSGISSNLPYDFISGDTVTINPEAVVQDIATLPRMYKDLDSIRNLFTGDDYIFFVYHEDEDGVQGSEAARFEAGTNPRNDMFEDLSNPDVRVYGQAARDSFYNKLVSNSAFNSDVYGSSAPTNSSIIGRIANSYIEISDYVGNTELKIRVTPTFDKTNSTLDYSYAGSLNLTNIKDFVANGINGNPVFAKIWFNPDSSISKTVPVKLYLYEGNNTVVDSGEGYFLIEFNLSVSSSETGSDIGSNATQIWEIPASTVITASYTQNGTTISTQVTNSEVDRISLTDVSESDIENSFIPKPASLDLKLLNLISSVSNNIADIQSFFVDDGVYTLKLDLGSGGNSIIGFDRNIVKYITGTFKTATNPVYPINVDDYIVDEGSAANICFTRPAEANLVQTSFDLSFTQRDRPGKGGFADDFTLSNTTVNFAAGDTQSCVTFTAVEDTHFDWAHDIFIDISSPSNDQIISRSRFKVTILDRYYPNRISWKRR